MSGQSLNVAQSRPLVTVIIPVYNRLQYVEQAVRSVLNQSHTNLQIIVVDDGSSSEVLPALVTVRDRIQFLTKTNGGQASARNFGVSHAKGEYLLFLDDDDLLESTAIEILIQALEDNPGSVWVAGQFAYMDAVGKSIESKPRSRYGSGDIYAQLIYENVIGAPSSVLVSNLGFQKVGGFDETRAYLMAEDYDLWLSFAAKWPLLTVDQTVTNYRLHQANVTGRQWARHFNAIIDVLRKHKQICRPGFDRAFNKSIANQFRQMGDDFYMQGEMSEARKGWRQSMAIYPRFPDVGILSRFIKSYVPQSLLRRLKKRTQMKSV